MKNRNLLKFLLIAFIVSIFLGYIFANYLEDQKIIKYENLEKEITLKNQSIDKEKIKIENIKINNVEIESRIRDKHNKSLIEAEDLILYEKLNGNRDIKGPGVEIVLADGEIVENSPYQELERYLKLVHNIDMLNLLNDLKLNGAESIEINGERVIETSEIYCSFAFISINDKKIPAPFKINVVGNTEELKKYMEKPFNLIESFKVRGLNIEYEFKDEVELKASNPYIDVR